MSKIKLAVIYYSATGTNYQLAQWAAESAEKAGAEVKLLKVQELVPEDKIAANPAMKALAEKTKISPLQHLMILWRPMRLFSVLQPVTVTLLLK